MKIIIANFRFWKVAKPVQFRPQLSAKDSTEWMFENLFWCLIRVLAVSCSLFVANTQSELSSWKKLEGNNSYRRRFQALSNFRCTFIVHFGKMRERTNRQKLNFSLEIGFLIIYQLLSFLFRHQRLDIVCTLKKCLQRLWIIQERKYYCRDIWICFP